MEIFRKGFAATVPCGICSPVMQLCSWQSRGHEEEEEEQCPVPCPSPALSLEDPGKSHENGSSLGSTRAAPRNGPNPRQGTCAPEAARNLSMCCCPIAILPALPSIHGAGDMAVGASDPQQHELSWCLCLMEKAAICCSKCNDVS